MNNPDQLTFDLPEPTEEQRAVITERDAAERTATLAILEQRRKQRALMNHPIWQVLSRWRAK